jgi:hypothetical protein
MSFTAPTLISAPSLARSTALATPSGPITSLPRAEPSDSTAER